MPLFDVLLAAELDGAERVSLAPEYCFRVKFECSRCRDVTDKFHVFTFADREPVPGGRGEATLATSCRNCKSGFSVDLVSTAADGAYGAADSGRPKRIGRMEVRGAVPVECQLGPGFVVAGPSGEVWPADLGGDDFCEYDEGAGVSVNVVGAALSIAPAEAGKR